MGGIASKRLQVQEGLPRAARCWVDVMWGVSGHRVIPESSGTRVTEELLPHSEGLAFTLQVLRKKQMAGK